MSSLITKPTNVTQQQETELIGENLNVSHVVSTVSSSMSFMAEVNKANDTVSRQTQQSQEHDVLKPSHDSPTVTLSVSKPITKVCNVKRTSTKGKASIGSGGSGIHCKEIDYLLDLIEKIQPLCRDEWEMVAAEHKKEFGDKQRTTDSLKKKFASLYRRKMPTDDPRMPEDVRRAKHLRHRLTELAEIGDGEHAVSVVDDVLPTESDDIDGSTGDDEETPQSGMLLSSMSTAQRTDTTPSHEATLPRPMVKKRHSRETEEDLTSIIKMIMVQEQARREEDLRRREEEHLEERLQREQDRRDELERRGEESKRHEQLMQLIIMLQGKPSQNNNDTS